MAWRCAATLACLASLSACGNDAPKSAVEHGRELFESRALSPSRLNSFACSTCHDLTAATSDRIKTGAPLAGASLRPSFWGATELDLLRAIDDCRSHFMEASGALAADDPNAEALYAFLTSLEPGDSGAQPFTIVRAVAALPRGDTDAGAITYAKACSACHGALHTGAGRLNTRIPLLPEDTLSAHADYDAATQRLIVIEKVRHGGFLGYGGDMPPFSSEVLGDEQLADVLEALGMLGQ